MKFSGLKKPALSLAAQYAATISLLVFISMGALTFMMVYNQIEENDRYINDFGRIITRQLAAASVEPLFANRPLELEVLISNFHFDNHISGAGIYRHDGQLLASKGELPPVHDIDFSLPVQSTAIEEQLTSKFTPYSILHISPIEFKGVTAGNVVIVFSTDIMNADFEARLGYILLASLFLVMVVILASIYLGKKLSHPISTLASAAESLQTGKLYEIKERRNDEIGQLINIINMLGADLLQKSQVENTLHRFLNKDVASKVMHQLDPVHMEGEHVHATVLFADIVGFTTISENLEPDQIQRLLNEYFDYLNACARFFFGNIDKFIGDCVMVVFGAPKEDPQHPYHAIACAELMQKLMKKLNERRRAEGLYTIELRVGINSGNMLAGLLGARERMEYTVVGDAVNLASRLCSEAESGEIVIEESLFKAVNPKYPMEVDSLKKIRVRGKKQPVNIYRVSHIQHAMPVATDDLIKDILEHNAY
ncbi:Adenylate cyclase 2 [BD1-7 clade bacterium]|uniref:Adenylate cyclase 2 n=1 Tax=BD1-7 clade bacterium TaxID=2029982 RepID=A0A5S9Q230_9GAMM|nr:Adenylate cyclase 2 [BD1-7 clade bacterium]CAA0112231.1 Adenylate cyclase 2 [BD1-7 clade bacterium]